MEPHLLPEASSNSSQNPHPLLQSPSHTLPTATLHGDSVEKGSPPRVVQNTRQTNSNRPQVTLQLPSSTRVSFGSSTRGGSGASSDGPPSSSGSFPAQTNEGANGSRNLGAGKVRHAPHKRHVHGSRSIREDQSELNELLRLTTASTPFHQSVKPHSNDLKREEASSSSFRGSANREDDESAPGDDQEVLLNALADCDALSEASSISADMTLATAETEDVSHSSKEQRQQHSRDAKKSQSINSRLASTEHILTLAENIANQRSGNPHQRRGDHLLYLHVHTMIRSHLLSSRALYGSPTCIAVAPVFPSYSTNSASIIAGPTLMLKALITVAIGTSRGFVLLFDAHWKNVGVLSAGVNASVQVVSLASDCSTVACNVRQSLYLWSLDVNIPKPGIVLHPIYTSSEKAFDEPLLSLQNMFGMPHGFLALEAHTGMVHVLALLSLLGKPMFLYRMCVIPSSIVNPTTSVDTLPFPSLNFYTLHHEPKQHKRANTRVSRSPVYPPLYTLLEQQRTSAEKSSFWSTSPTASDHLIVAANNQGVTLLRACVNPPSLSYSILCIWDIPRFSKCPPLVHLFAFQENGRRNIGVLVSCEGALFVVEVLKAGLYPSSVQRPSSLVGEESKSAHVVPSALRLRSMLSWDSNAFITGIWVVGNGSVVVLDQKHIMTLVDAVAGVTVEHHVLPHNAFLFDLPVNSLYGNRAGGSRSSSGIHQGVPYSGVITCTPDLFFLSATLLTWQERIDSMLHHRRFTAALQYIRELMLDVGLAVNGWAAEGCSKGEKEHALVTYMEIVSLSFLENTLQQGKRVLPSQEKATRVEKTVSAILSFCQHKALEHAFWSRVMGFLREHHEAALGPAMLAIRHGITTGIVRNIPAAYLFRFVDTVLNSSGRNAEDKAHKENIESLLLNLSGDLFALQEVAKNHHFKRLAIHITSFFGKKHTEALLLAIEEDRNTLHSLSVQAKPFLSIQFLSVFLVGKTFTKSLEYPKTNHNKACEQLLLDVYTNYSIRHNLLELNALETVDVLLNYICSTERNRNWCEAATSAPVWDSKDLAKVYPNGTLRNVNDKLQPVRFALRVFVDLIYLHPLTDTLLCDRGAYKEEDFLQLDVVTPFLYRIISNTPQSLSRALAVQQALLRMWSIIMRYATSLSEAENNIFDGKFNWCLFLPVLAQISILQYKSADSVEVRRQIQQELSAYFRSPHLRNISLHFWKIKCHAARMSRVAACICFRDGRYGEAIDYYLDDSSSLEDPTLSRDLFDVLHKEMFSLSIGAELVSSSLSKDLSSNSRINQLRCAVIDRVVLLRKVDHTALVSFYLRYQSKKEEDLLHSFGGSTQKLLAFLEQLIESKDDALRGNIHIQNQYIELLCIHDPEKVYPYLRDHDNGISYDKSIAIQCSQKHGVYPATVYLLTASNRLSEALDYTCSTIDQLLMKAKNSMDDTTTWWSEGILSWGDDEKTNKAIATDLIRQVSPQLLEVLLLGIEVGRAANEEGTWLRLIQLFDPASATPEFSYHSNMKGNNDDAGAERGYRDICDAGLALVMNGICHSLGSAPLFNRILHVVPSCRWAPSFPPVLSLLQEEVKMYQCATSVAESDALKWTKEFIRSSRRGVVSSGPLETGSVLSESSSFTHSMVCGACAEPLQRRENGLLVDNVICLYTCGHGYHEECMSTAESVVPSVTHNSFRCSVCVKKCISKGTTSTILQNTTVTPNESDLVNFIETQYFNVRRVRGLLDFSGERTSAMKNIISVLPAPEKLRNNQFEASPSVNRGIPPATQRDDEIGNVLYGMSSEEILRLFGST